MASGSGGDGPAYADRLREKYAKHNRLTQKALDDARNPVSSLPPPGTEPYREEMDSVTETKVGKDGLTVKTTNPYLVPLLAFFALIAFVAWLRWH